MIEGAGGVICFVGLGANMGRPAAQCNEATQKMHATNDIQVVRRSSLYRSEPVGDRQQDWFVNAVVEIRTLLQPGELLPALLSIETAMGRKRDAPGGPRIIDLDLLLYGQQVIEGQDIVIPHPAFHKRRFVLVPLHEIAPYVIHPAFGVSIHGLLDRLDDDHKVELIQRSE
ncbi:MAG: 2-amino-4-hydroxy-6-hydroxymethyldihydropteridine diphosphokinase [Syntrophus sp. (in: bacteria)]|nr:2-amino-4-hydroxy-6-hydroxymethyldihydropteridine diphosphokinase [Syntrophus sp. (in: bacteria)]